MREKYEEELIKLFLIQRRTRDRGDLAVATKILDQIDSLLASLPIEQIGRELSRSAYERAYILGLQGNTQESSRCFSQSAEYARIAGDDLRRIVGEFRAQLTLYLGNTDDAETIFQYIRIIYEDLNAIDSIPEADREFFLNTQHNILNRLTQISFEIGSGEFEFWSEAMLSHERVVRGTADKVSIYVHAHQNAVARRHMMAKNYVAAIEIFERYLPTSPDEYHRCLAEHGSMSSGMNFALTDAEEIAREFRDFGLAAFNDGRPLSNQRAAQIWQVGLLQGPNNGNARYIEDIKRLLAQVG